ncbi:MAG: hypothetical protein Q8T08_19525 [Ignavibacteria bacterium]|jgi:hypothetical protein|nr:hypothetical protein [Ignavibacteria bacterium]
MVSGKREGAGVFLERRATFFTKVGKGSGRGDAVFEAGGVQFG